MSQEKYNDALNLLAKQKGFLRFKDFYSKGVKKPGFYAVFISEANAQEAFRKLENPGTQYTLANIRIANEKTLINLNNSFWQKALEKYQSRRVTMPSSRNPDISVSKNNKLSASNKKVSGNNGVKLSEKYPFLKQYETDQEVSKEIESLSL